jgi:hypothetical protein
MRRSAGLPAASGRASLAGMSDPTTADTVRPPADPYVASPDELPDEVRGRQEALFHCFRLTLQAMIALSDTIFALSGGDRKLACRWLLGVVKHFDPHGELSVLVDALDQRGARDLHGVARAMVDISGDQGELPRGSTPNEERIRVVLTEGRAHLFALLALAEQHGGFAALKKANLPIVDTLLHRIGSLVVGMGDPFAPARPPAKPS